MQHDELTSKIPIVKHGLHGILTEEKITFKLNWSLAQFKWSFSSKGKQSEVISEYGEYMRK